MNKNIKQNDKKNKNKPKKKNLPSTGLQGALWRQREDSEGYPLFGFPVPQVFGGRGKDDAGTAGHQECGQGGPAQAPPGRDPFLKIEFEPFKKNRIITISLKSVTIFLKYKFYPFKKKKLYHFS